MPASETQKPERLYKPEDFGMPQPIHKGVNTDELREVYSVPAPYANKIYVTSVNGIQRLAFCETIPEANKDNVRVAVSMTFQDLMNVAAFLNDMIQRQIKAANEQMQKQDDAAKPNMGDLLTQLTSKKPN